MAIKQFDSKAIFSEEANQEAEMPDPVINKDEKMKTATAMSDCQLSEQ